MTPQVSPAAKAPVTASMFERVMSRVEFEPNTGCWLCSYAGPNGYAGVSLHGARDLAHRISWKHHFGEIPAALWVLHRCDTPACCNPDHLFLGTPADNTRDMHNKGRGVVPPARRGLSSLSAKLTPNSVRDIRRLYRPSTPGNVANPFSSVGLGRRYGVKPDTIMRVIQGENWGHVK